MTSRRLEDRILRTSTAHGGITAAGAGRRLTNGMSSKGLFKVNGEALVDHVLRQFKTAQIKNVVVSIRETDHELRDHIESRGNAYGFDSLQCLEVQDGAGTGLALQLLTEAIGPHAHLISTVDLMAPDGMALDLSLRAEQHYREGRNILCVVAVTPLINDSEPSWVRLDPDGFVTDFGKRIRPSGAVFGNLRWFAPDAYDALLELPAWGRMQRDSEVMRALVRQHRRSVVSADYKTVYDVDEIADVVLAEAWLHEQATQLRRRGSARHGGPRDKRVNR